MSKKLLIALVGIGLLFATSAMAVELRFSEIQMPIGTTSSVVVLTGGEYASFGITVENVYRYHDSRDPFSDGAEDQGGTNPYGLSYCNDDVSGCEEIFDPARITFSSPVSNLSIDWWTISDTIFLEVFDTAGNSIFFLNGGSGSGTEVVNMSDIGSITWHDSGGFVQVSNIRFDTVPEPGTLALFGLGSLILGFRRRSR